MERIFWVLMLMAISISVGCTSFSSTDRSLHESGGAGSSLTRLAGTWEYEENGMTYPIVLDSTGQGSYDWQDGQFKTLSLSKGRWVGTWHQKRNDREGKFEAQLSERAHAAKGRWWYTRIGDDREPIKPGGTFTLTRQPVVACGGAVC